MTLLRIKGDKDLNVLETLGFDTSIGTGDYFLFKKETNDYAGIVVNSKNRLIYLERGYGGITMNCLPVLFDLIQLGLVEKVDLDNEYLK